MATREITVVAPSSNKAKTLNSEAETWEELKSELGNLYNDNLEAVVAGSKVSLTRDDAELPEGEFNLYLVTKKNKSGSEGEVCGATELVKALFIAIGTDKEEDLEDFRELMHSRIDSFFDSADATEVKSKTKKSASGMTAKEEAAMLEAKRL
jgi:hypothetical protein